MTLNRQAKSAVFKSGFLKLSVYVGWTGDKCVITRQILKTFFFLWTNIKLNLFKRRNTEHPEGKFLSVWHMLGIKPGTNGLSDEEYTEVRE